MTRAKRRLFFIYAKQRMLFGKTSRNKLSRFVDEVAEEHIKKPPPERRSTWDFLSGSRDLPPESRGFARETPGVRRPAPHAPAPPPPQENVRIAVGDAVSHRAFGKGVVKSMTRTGGDTLVEIEFAGVGRKRLMLKAAAAYMTKL
jgi:DNA helicase-2/ATP-dependent DNA helicase PcrA